MRSQLLTQSRDIVIRQNGRVQCVLALPWAESGMRTSVVLELDVSTILTVKSSPATFVFSGHYLDGQSGAQAARSVRSGSGMTHDASNHIFVRSSFQHDLLAHAALLT